MTKIYLIRHAEAEGNLYRRIQGHYNSDLTARAYKQIDCLAERFRDIPLDALYASDLIRTQKTAEAITRHHGLPITVEPRLKEVNMGVWEDVPWGNAAFDQPEQMGYFSCDPKNWHISGSEDFNDLRSRVTGIVTRLGQAHDGQTIACFSHGMAIRALISGVLGVSSENIGSIKHGDNTCVALLTCQDGQLSLDYYNDNTHLTPEVSTFANQSWWKSRESLDVSNLRFIPMDLDSESERYCACYREGWAEAHGTVRGYEPGPYLKSALRVSALDPQALVSVYSCDTFAGVIELDPERLAAEGAGWISFCYIVPELRRKNFGVQLIGHAVSFYRKRGRKSLRLNVAESNRPGIAFYKKYGFRQIGTCKGSICTLLTMEKTL